LFLRNISFHESENAIFIDEFKTKEMDRESIAVSKIIRRHKGLETEAGDFNTQQTISPLKAALTAHNLAMLLRHDEDEDENDEPEGEYGSGMVKEAKESNSSNSESLKDMFTSVRGSKSGNKS
jgi:hypothetical protein